MHLSGSFYSTPKKEEEGVAMTNRQDMDSVAVARAVDEGKEGPVPVAVAEDLDLVPVAAAVPADGQPADGQPADDEPAVPAEAVPVTPADVTVVTSPLPAAPAEEI